MRAAKSQDGWSLRRLPARSRWKTATPNGNRFGMAQKTRRRRCRTRHLSRAREYGDVIIRCTGSRYTADAACGITIIVAQETRNLCMFSMARIMVTIRMAMDILQIGSKTAPGLLRLSGKRTDIITHRGSFRQMQFGTGRLRAGGIRRGRAIRAESREIAAQMNALSHSRLPRLERGNGAEVRPARRWRIPVSSETDYNQLPLRDHYKQPGNHYRYITRQIPDYMAVIAKPLAVEFRH